MKKCMYLAGGMHSGWQDKVKAELDVDYKFFDPREHGLKNVNEYVLWDKLAIVKSDIMIIHMEADNPGSWNCIFEAGIAVALNIPVIMIDGKSAADPNFAKYSGMIKHECVAVYDNMEDAIIAARKLSVVL